MDDAQLAKIFAEGNTKSFADGLRAVYEAGIKGEIVPDIPAVPVFSEMTNAELKDYLDKHGVYYPSNADKADLMRLSRAAAKKDA